MKKKLNRKGFTLVELIVVIAILAILAGVAIPVYSGYIQKANEAADLQTLDSVKTACVFAVTEKRVPETTTIEKIEVSGTDVTVHVSETASTYGTNGDVAISIEPYTGTLNFKNITEATWVATASGTLKEGWNIAD